MTQDTEIAPSVNYADPIGEVDYRAKWLAAEAILDNPELKAIDKLVAMGIVRHADENLQEATPTNKRLMLYAGVRDPETIAAAIDRLKNKHAIVSNRHVVGTPRVFKTSLKQLITEAVVEQRRKLAPEDAAIKSLGTTPIPSGEGVCRSRRGTPIPSEADHADPVGGGGMPIPSGYPDQTGGVRKAGVSRSDRGGGASDHADPIGGVSRSRRGGPHALRLSKDSKSKSVKEVQLSDASQATDLLGGRGPVTGVEFPTVLVEIIDKGSAPAATKSLVDAVKRELRAGVPAEKIENSLLKAVADAEKHGDVSPSAVLRRCISYAMNAKVYEKTPQAHGANVIGGIAIPDGGDFSEVTDAEWME